MRDMTKPIYHVVSFSGGKDSTAMVLRMIELGYQIDEVLFCDTTMEFPGMIRHVEKVKKVIEAAGIKFVTLRSEKSFEYYLAEIDVPNRKPDSDFFGVPGYGWPSHKIRWCTKHLKTELIHKHLEHLREDHEVIQYIGIAADEDSRMAREGNQDPSHRHPLRDWGWIEEDAMRYCVEKGYDWEGLYELKKNPKTGRARVSCWCCPLQSYDDLRVLHQHFPDLWEQLLELDRKQCKPFFAHGYKIQDFDKRFTLEEELTAAGHSITNKAFFADLKRLLAEEVTIEQILMERTEEG